MNLLPMHDGHGPSRDRWDASDPSKIPNLSGAWESLGISVPTISAYAYLCAHALFETVSHHELTNSVNLSGSAKTILYLARATGAMELKVTPRAFRPSERFLALYVHISDEDCLVFQDSNDPKVAIEFLAAFRELCLSGFCIHQLHGEFSLNHRGFEFAQTIQQPEVETWLSKAQNSSAM